MNLHAARRPEPNRAGGERLPQQGGGDEQTEHADATDGRETRVVGESETRGGRKALEMNGPWKADTGSRNGHVVGWELGRDAARASLVDLTE
jgi:hypothetical protein